MERLNCWEHKACGEAKENCPAYTQRTYEGVNGGAKSGRLCWVAAGTFCGKQVKGVFAKTRGNCMNCDFFQRVKREEEADFKLLKSGIWRATSQRDLTL